MCAGTHVRQPFPVFSLSVLHPGAKVPAGTGGLKIRALETLHYGSPSKKMLAPIRGLCLAGQKETPRQFKGLFFSSLPSLAFSTYSFACVSLLLSFFFTCAPV